VRTQGLALLQDADLDQIALQLRLQLGVELMQVEPSPAGDLDGNDAGARARGRPGSGG